VILLLEWSSTWPLFYIKNESMKQREYARLAVYADRPIEETEQKGNMDCTPKDISVEFQIREHYGTEIEVCRQCGFDCGY
jgi:hypothetical protein